MYNFIKTKMLLKRLTLETISEEWLSEIKTLISEAHIKHIAI